jgi:hypothetical protein
MQADSDRIDDTVLALMCLNAAEARGAVRTGKDYGREVMARLHRRGWISNPAGNARSVVLTREGRRRGETLVRELFGGGGGAERPRESLTPGALYLRDATRRLREAKSQADRALAQVSHERWRLRLDPGSNSLTTLILHLSGNMISRWTDFLSTDGEKPDRHRDAEFEDSDLSRDELVERWERGWACLFEALAGLGESDLSRTVLIRAQSQTVLEAVNRQIAHYSVHVGQMLFLAKHLAGAGWSTLSIPRGGSGAFNAKTRAKPST